MYKLLQHHGENTHVICEATLDQCLSKKASEMEKEAKALRRLSERESVRPTSEEEAQMSDTERKHAQVRDVRYEIVEA